MPQGMRCARTTPAPTQGPVTCLGPFSSQAHRDKFATRYFFSTVVKLTHEAPKAVPMQPDMPLSHDAFASPYSAYPCAAGD
jgi:hypothetical protein